MENYYEVQSFNKWWVRLLFLIPVCIAMYGMLNGITAQSNIWGIVIKILILAAVGALFFFTKLETRIDETGVTIRFFPFQRMYYYVKWEEIQEAQIRKYNPLMEYGGWGIRYSFTNGKAYNIAGNKGLQLTLLSGKRFLIGTQNEEELGRYLKHLKEEKGIASIA
jgi:hypothetical protein